MVTCLLETAELQAEFCEAEIAVTSKSRFSTSRESVSECAKCARASSNRPSAKQKVPGSR